MNHPQIAGRVFNTPLLVAPAKAQAMVAGFGPRILGSGPVSIDGGDPIPSGAYRRAKPFASLLDQSLTEAVRQGHRRGYALRGGVAVIPVTGTLVHRGAWIGQSSGQTSYEGIEAAFLAADEDPAVKAIGMEVDSFGGQVSGCFGLCKTIADIGTRKPVRAFIAEHAYSAAYALASQAEQIYLPPTGGAGSIGVILMHADYSNALDQAGIDVTIISAGEHKADGNPYAPLPISVREELQSEMEMLRGIFAETVGEGRGDRMDAEAALATKAKCFLGEAAVENNLADHVAEPRAAFEEFIAEMNAEGAWAPPASKTMSQVEEEPEMTTTDTTTAPEAGAETEDPANGADTQVETPAASTETKEPAAEGNERQRIAAILNSPEAEGRSDLAKHLAFETDHSPEACNAILKTAAKSAGGQLAGAMEGDDTDIDSPAGGSAKGPSVKAAVNKRFGNAA
jgi:signal peptide peptidase SppA